MTRRSLVVFSVATALVLVTSAAGEESAEHDAVLARATLRLVSTSMSGTIVQAGDAQVVGGRRGTVRATSRAGSGGAYVTSLDVRAGGAGAMRARGRVRFVPSGARYSVRGTVRVTRATGIFRSTTAVRVIGHGTTKPARLSLSLTREGDGTDG